MKDMDRMIGRAQIALAFFFAIAFIGLLAVLLIYSHEIADTTRELIKDMMQALLMILSTQTAFFFARSRPPADPPPPGASP